MLRVLCLIFTEGYAASTGEELLRADLTDEAILQLGVRKRTAVRVIILDAAGCLISGPCD